MFMRVRTRILIIIVGLLFLMGTVEAVGTPDTVTVVTDKPWIVANNGDTSAITVTVLNTTAGFNGGVPNVILNLAVDPVYGTLSPATITTNAAGVASSTFRVKTKSGAAQITATTNTPTLSGVVIQNIDHEVPANAILQYPLEGEVGSIVALNISVIDRWGNPVDGRNPSQIHSVSLRIDGPANDCGFKDGALYLQTLTRNLSINGNLSLQIRLSKIIGDNNIQIASPFTLTKIVGISSGAPVRMTGSLSKSGGEGLANDEVRANREDYFILDYSLFDVYGNPVRNRSISVKTNLTEETTPKIYTTNSLGKIQIKYGPKISILTSKITANSTDNSSVGNVMVVKFINSGQPTSMILIVTPEIMASRDTPAEFTTQQARVVARLLDDWGNPIPNKVVDFSMSNVENGTYILTDYPEYPKLSASTATTDDKGNAIVTFYPGSFVTEGQPGYSDTASGSCIISATSGSLTSPSPVKVEWKNFAYLSVTANATPQTVHQNDTIDVTIRVTADGYKMVQRPLSVVLDMDATSSLHANNGADGFPRDDGAKAAGKYFVDGMSSQDQVGLVTYGNFENNVFWLQIENVTYVNKAALDTSIDSLNLSQGVGGTSYSMRESIDAATYNITHNPLYYPGEVDAIITIGDSSYHTTDFQPMVDETWGSSSKIRIYSIQYVSSVASQCDVTKIGGTAHDLKALTDATHGLFYCNDTLEDVKASFDKIKQNLSTLVTTDAVMDLDFKNVNVSSNLMSGGEVFSYVPVGPFSPLQTIVNPNGRTSIIWPNGTQSVIDQSDNWTAANNYQLKFDVGTLHVKETWEAIFRLKVNKTGDIQLFGPGSSISYNGGSGNLKLPLTYIKSISNETPLGLGSGILDLSDLKVSGAITDSIPLQWNLTYTGFKTATETISYSYNNGYSDGPWIVLDTRTNNPPLTEAVIHTAQLSLQGATGGSYRIRVHADTPDAGSDEMIIGTPPIGSRNATLLLK